MSHKMGAGEERASFIYQGANVGGHGNLSTVVKPPRPRYRHVYMRTTFLYVLFFYLGITGSLLGTTLVHLQVYLNEDSAKFWSLAFIIFSGGYMLGGFLCGLLFDRLNWEMLFSCAAAVIGTAVGLAQFSSDYVGFLIIWTIANVAMGYVDAAGQSYGVSLWDGKKHKEPIIQMIHVIWSAGATIGPLIVRPFLIPLPPSTPVNSTTFTVNATTDNPLELLLHQTTDAAVTWSFESANESEANSTLTPPGAEGDITQLRYAYIIVGLLGTVPLACFLFAFCKYTPRRCINMARKTPGYHDSDSNSGRKGDRRSYLVCVYIVLALFFCSYLIVEMTPGTLLGLFVVEGLGWEATSVSAVMSTFWGFHCLGRLLGVPVSMVISPALMLSINLVVLFVAFCILYVGTLFADWLVWLSIAASALGMATTFATGILLADQYIVFGGAAASVVIMAGSVGGAAGPPLATFLFATYGHMTFVYMMLGATLALTLSFVTLYLLLRCFGSKKHNEVKY